ncbi:MAG: M28 family peptidase [Planctomycetes bacterium]|nr:M28 family peptidase [Planctomycetota bacterium]
MLLKNLPVVLFATVALGQSPPASNPDAPQPPGPMGTIHVAELKRHATFLASDELGGRLTGSPGQEAAAKYIAEHFAQLGLEPLGDLEPTAGGERAKRSFFQRYGLKRTHTRDETALTFGATTRKDGFAVLGAQATDVTVEGTLRWCGLGRTRGSEPDVPTEESLDGRIAVVAIKPPRGKVQGDLSVEQKFGMSFGVFGQFGRTAKALAKKGAGAVLFVQHEDPIGLCDVLNYLALAPGKDSVEANFPGADPGMGGLGRMGGGGDVPTLVMSVSASLELAKALGVDLAAFAAEPTPQEAKVDVAGKLRLAIAYDPEATASNVVAVLRGSDPQLADEAIVYSAHMDHVGRRMDGEVFNGADDNASGSSGLMAIASAYAKAAERPRRSIIFLSVSGEELGLWGSQYYSDNPTWPLDKIVADINTDMIGRSGPESGPTEVTVTPSFRHAKYSTLARDAAGFAAVLGATFTDGDKYYTRSDHYNFAKKGVPVVFFCNGEHEDYHQVTDEVDKLDFPKMERIARLAFWTGWHTANADERPRTIGRQEQW